MKYYKIVSGEYVVAFGIGSGAVEITKTEYESIKEAASLSPVAPSGYTYKLRAADLEWELVELPPEPDPGEEDATAEDYEQALANLGVRV